MKCEKCGHQNPRGARYCGYCQRELERKQGGALFKKYGILIVSCVAVLCIMIIILIQKDESPAQVTEPVGVTGPEETVHIHTWTDATCTAYATCTGCGITNGFKLSHKWTEGNCLEPGVCEVCGTVSTLPAHQWGKGMPKTCKLCGKVWASTTNAEGETLLDATVDSVIRERLPIATYAMADAEKVYSYSDATLTEQTKQYYFNSQTDEIVILDISEDGSAMYVRYPSTISGAGYRDRWFATEDVLGELGPDVSEYNVDTIIKTYKKFYNSVDVESRSYEVVVQRMDGTGDETGQLLVGERLGVDHAADTDSGDKDMDFKHFAGLGVHQKLRLVTDPVDVHPLSRYPLHRHAEALGAVAGGDILIEVMTELGVLVA